MAAPLARAAVAVAHLAEVSLSIIIPVLNEGAGLDAQLSRLRATLGNQSTTELIVSDGGSTDETLGIAKQHGCHIVTGSAGRALQLNRGAEAATGLWLLFLHADTRLPEGFQAHIVSARDWGFFKLKLSGSQQVYRLIEAMINWRSSFSSISTGDQAQFFGKEFFKAIGCYPEIPLMEDVAISKNAKRQARPTVIEAPVETSSRRWEKHGVLKTILLMWWLRFAFMIGVSAKRLHRMYYPQHD